MIQDTLPNLTQMLETINQTTPYPITQEIYFSMHECSALIMDYSRIYTVHYNFMFYVGLLFLFAYIYIEYKKNNYFQQHIHFQLIKIMLLYMTLLFFVGHALSIALQVWGYL